MKDTCKQAIFRKDTRSRSRAEDPLRAGDQEERELEYFNKLNHDLFTFTKAVKEGWQMNGRWIEGGLVIELFKTTRASIKFDRMIPSESSWLMGIKVQRVLDHARSAMEPGNTISM